MAKEMIAAFHDPALSRKVLGLSDDYEPLIVRSPSRLGITRQQEGVEWHLRAVHRHEETSMELAVSAAKPRLSELIAAVRRGERVVITERGEPAAELVACAKPSPSAEAKPEGDFFVRLEAARKQLGIKAMPPEEARAFRAALHDSALSRRVLGVDDE